MAEKFVMVSLEEDKTRKIAEVLSNDTARKILDYLAEREDASESDIAKALSLPLSTVHYNIKNLVNCHFAESKEFRWSEKGKHIDLYTIAKKYVIIAPKSSKDLKEKLKTILPGFLVSLGGAILIQFWYQTQKAAQATTIAAPKMMQEAAVALAPQPAAALAPAMLATASPAIWFLAGAWLTILIFVAGSWRSKT